MDAYVSIGSNVEPERHILAALELLRRRVRITGVSMVYRTAPLGPPGQPAFLNGVWRIRTDLTPRAVKFDVLRPIEEALLRRREQDRYASRTIDLDLLLHGEAVIDEPDLQLPSPDIDRPFVAVPLLELVLPCTHERLSSMSAAQARAGLTPLPDFTRRLRESLKEYDEH